MEGLGEYRMVGRRLGSPALDVRVGTPSITWTACNEIVGDAELDNWHWKVTALACLRDLP